MEDEEAEYKNEYNQENIVLNNQSTILPKNDEKINLFPRMRKRALQTRV
jgi:hypothetical protein